MGSGLGFDYKWDMGWMNDTLESIFRTDPLFRGGAYHKLDIFLSYVLSGGELSPSTVT